MLPTAFVVRCMFPLLDVHHLQVEMAGRLRFSMGWAVDALYLGERYRFSARKDDPVNSRLLLRHVANTLAVAAAGGALAGLLLSLFAPASRQWSPSEWLLGAVGWLGSGMVFGALSLLGYVAFAFLDQFGRASFSPAYRPLWDTLLWGISLFVLFDLLVFPSGWQAIGISPPVPGVTVLLFAWALIVTAVRFRGFPFRRAAALVFFLFPFTLFELVPALRLNNVLAFWDMALPILFANTYHVLVSGRLTATRRVSPAPDNRG